MNSPQNRVSLNLCADPQLVREVLNWALRYLIQTPHAAKYRDFQKDSRKKRNFTNYAEIFQRMSQNPQNKVAFIINTQNVFKGRIERSSISEYSL